jgi:hypothetical protein
MMRWLPMASAGISILTTLALIARDYPLIGHDYRYFIPRLIDTDLHLRLNGLFSIQWYTPSFGSGIPAFPNPQHLQYSLIQALTFISDPWIAVLATTALVIALGFWSCFQLARVYLGLGAHAATLSALFLVSNGLIIERAIVGHIGFQLFPLVTVMVWALIDGRWANVPRGALLGLTIAMTLYHGGAIVIVLEAMAIALCLPMLIAFRPQLFNAQRLLRTSLTGAVFAVALSAPKILAGMMMLRQLPRQFSNEPVVSLAESIGGFVSQLAGVHTLAPLLMAMNIEAARAYGAMVHLGGSGLYGVWELDTGLSPILFVCLIIGGWSAWQRRNDWASLLPVQRTALMILAIGSWLALEAATGRGFIYPLLKTLPILNTFHVSARFVAVFILPLALGAGIAVDRWLTDRERSGALLIVATLLAPLTYFLLPSDLHDRGFHVSETLRQVPALRESGGRVDRLEVVTDAEALSIGASSLAPYEPLFGYSNETFKPETHPGDIRVAAGGYWNMTNPAGFVFPAENGLRKFERIREDDRDRLEQFLQRRQPDWRRPAILAWSTRLAVPALMLCLLTIAFGFRSSRAAG